MKYFYHILRILVGLTFIISALAKLFPIEPFENTFIELGVSNWAIAPFLARFVIAFELFLGFSILFNIWVKNKIYYLAQATLIFFTSYLVYLLVTKGNNVDCGCFGSLIELSPIESIIKNVLLMICLFFVPRQYYKYGDSYIFTTILALSISLPILINPIGIHNVQGIEVDEKIDFIGLPPLYKQNTKVNFSKGEKIVAFLSYKCSHCINATKKFVLLDKEKKVTNLYLVVGSKKEEGLLNFIDETKPHFPIIWMNDDSFFSYAGGKLPAIIYIEDGVMKKKWFGDLFDVEDISKYFTN